eukprot:gb/GEZN01007619.1/.p1 GENE.gb/GEZN01007619.1/~~gb/GEZN01007619.1/.p1  ORF type:complete len:423 (-),score=34.46 gb/GEZN01007619.1/:162-1430(-)
MATSAIYILDAGGKVLISRHYRGDVTKSAAQAFTKHLQEETDVHPIFSDGGNTYIHIKHNDLYVMAITKRNANVMLILSFLYRLVEVLTDYFGELEEETIKDNFVITYELLDEMMDFGYPQSTDSKILKEYICVAANTKAPKTKGGLAAPTPTYTTEWRPQGIKYKKNDVFLDVVEQLDCLISHDGTSLKSEIRGTLKMKACLSGMPELKLGLNDKLLMDRRSQRTADKTVQMEDIRFHQCVRLARFEQDRTISFVPPDGEFDLMHYRLNTKVKAPIWVKTDVRRFGGRIEFQVKVKSNYKRRSIANNVEIIIPVPPDADSPVFKKNYGTVKYAPEKSAVIWSMKQFQGRKEYLMNAKFGLPSIQSEEKGEAREPVRVKFELPYFTISGIQVRYLKITEKSRYQAFPWVRYITRNGDYQIRI